MRSFRYLITGIVALCLLALFFSTYDHMLPYRLLFAALMLWSVLMLISLKNNLDA